MRSSARVRERKEEAAERERTAVHPVLYVKTDWAAFTRTTVEQRRANEALDDVIEKMRANEKGFTRTCIQDSLQKVAQLMRQAAEVDTQVDGGNVSSHIVTGAIDAARAHALGQGYDEHRTAEYVASQAAKALQTATERNQRERERLQQRLAAIDEANNKAKGLVDDLSAPSLPPAPSAAPKAPAAAKKRKARPQKQKQTFYYDDGTVDERSSQKRAADARSAKQHALRDENTLLKRSAAHQLQLFVERRVVAGLCDSETAARVREVVKEYVDEQALAPASVVQV